MNSNQNPGSVQNVHFRYCSATVPLEINLEITRGDFLAVIDPNGSGKITLLKLILGSLRPNKVRIKLFGQNIKSMESYHSDAIINKTLSIKASQIKITITLLFIWHR